LRVLVTGGAGFIGSHIVDALVAVGHRVVVVDDLSGGKEENLNPAARFYRLDVCSPELEKVFRDEKIEFVNHHAAQIDVRRSVADPMEDARVNIQGLLNILENCRRFQVRGVVFASSGGVVYGEPQALPVAENYPKGPLSPYGVSKLSSEYYLYCFAQVAGLPYVALRYGNVYGPRQDPHGEAGVVAIFGLKMLAGETPVIYGDGEQLRDYVYVGDVVRANLLAMRRLLDGRERKSAQSDPGGAAGAGAPGESAPAPGVPGVDGPAYNIGTGVGTSVNELFALLSDLTGYRGEAQRGPERPGELRRIYLDCTRAFRELGWRPEVSLREGLRRTVEFLAGARHLTY